jgi:NADPH-dependent curcumin reductase CurA
MSAWIREGKLRWGETVVEGIERAPEAFIGLFTGENLGKMLVKL